VNGTSHRVTLRAGHGADYHPAWIESRALMMEDFPTLGRPTMV
jgi:hypothetical protein